MKDLYLFQELSFVVLYYQIYYFVLDAVLNKKNISLDYDYGLIDKKFILAFYAIFENLQSRYGFMN